MNEKLLQDNKNLVEFWDGAFTIPEEEKQAIRESGLSSPDEMAPSEKLLKAAAGLGAKKKVLDLGCGNGWAAAAAAKNGCGDVTAADPAPNAAETARFIAELCGVGDRVHAVCGGNDWLKTAPAGTFDGIFISNVLDTVPPETAEELLREAARVAAEDAEIVIGLNYYLSPEKAAEKDMELTDGCKLYMDGVLRLVSRTDEEWAALFEPYFTVENLEYFAWQGEPEEKRRLFRLREKKNENPNKENTEMIQFKEGYYADIRIEDRFRTTISYKAGVLEEMKTRNEKQAFLRVYDGKLWYYASVTDVDHLQKTLDGLYAAATANPAILEDPIVKRFEVNRDELSNFMGCSVRDIPLAKKQELLLSYLPILSEEPAVTLPEGKYLDRNSKFRFLSSLGADVAYDYQTCGIVLSFAMAEGEKQFHGSWSNGVTRFEELRGLEETIRGTVREQADSMRSAVPVEAGKYPVVLSPEAAGVFAHESFGHKSEADFMISDETMKEEWQLGKAVGSPILSIAESGAIPGSGFVPYDDEGTKARKNYLIKNGVLAGRLHSAQTAAALDEELTGNARAIDCEFEPIVRMTTTYIEGGDLSFDELIAPIEKGYFIKTVKHGSGMSTFTIAPKVAYEIVNGKLGRPAQISVISGNVFETLGLIDGLTRDVELLSFVGGGCGKIEQYPLPVGFGGPYVRVSEMNVQ